MSHAPVLAALLGLATVAARADLPNYVQAGSFHLPEGSAAYDVLPDGRVIAVRGDDILIQDAVNASSFSLLGSLPAGFIAGEAAFLRVNPSGTHVAIGDNDYTGTQEVGVFALASIGDPAFTRIAAPNFDAVWADDRTFFVAGSGVDTVVTRVDLLSGGGAVGSVVINDFSGFSGGIAIGNGYLYTSDGFSLGGPSGTGEIRAFDLAALDGSSVFSFDNDGIVVADLLSGASLGFDAFGNLLVGGGDPFGGGEFGFIGVIDGDAIFPFAPPGGVSLADILAIDSPFGEDTNFVLYNAATGELLVTIYGSSLVYRYAVPAPGAAALLALGGLAAARRRRHA